MANNQEQLLHPQHIDIRKAEQLIDDNIDLTKRLVRGFIKNHRSNIEELELVNSAILGLIDAVNRFNPEKGEHFRSYARIRIRGALLDKVRQEDPLSRNKRNFAKQLEIATYKLECRLQRQPSNSEVATELNLTLERFQHLLSEIQQDDSNIDNLDKKLEQKLSGGSVGDILDFENQDPLARLLNMESSHLVEAALNKLKAKHRLCIRLSFYENIPLTQIAEIMEISISRVSQIRSEALAMMKQSLIQVQ